MPRYQVRIIFTSEVHVDVTAPNEEAAEEKATTKIEKLLDDYTQGGGISVEDVDISQE